MIKSLGHRKSIKELIFSILKWKYSRKLFKHFKLITGRISPDVLGTRERLETNWVSSNEHLRMALTNDDFRTDGRPFSRSKIIPLDPNEVLRGCGYKFNFITLANCLRTQGSKVMLVQWDVNNRKRAHTWGSDCLSEFSIEVVHWSWTGDEVVETVACLIVGGRNSNKGFAKVGARLTGAWSLKIPIDRNREEMFSYPC